MEYTLGTNLSAEDQQHVLAAFVHRFTGEHRPAWSNKPAPNGGRYKAQFRDDADWLAHSRFAVRTNGRLDRRAKSCFSNPTWPDGPGFA